MCTKRPIRAGAELYYRSPPAEKLSLELTVSLQVVFQLSGGGRQQGQRRRHRGRRHRGQRGRRARRGELHRRRRAGSGSPRGRPGSS